MLSGGCFVNLLFKFLLTVNATSWMFVVYGIKEGITLWKIPQWALGLILLCIPIVLSIISIEIIDKTIGIHKRIKPKAHCGIFHSVIPSLIPYTTNIHEVAFTVSRNLNNKFTKHPPLNIQS